MLLVIVGAKFCLLNAVGSPLPFFDAWMGEGDSLLRPWMEGSWSWVENLWEPFYQHRITLTRLFVIGVFEANAQQWDTRAEATVAVVLHVAVAVGLALILVRRIHGRGQNAWTDGLLGMIVLLFALPFNWENTLAGGFQSQFYFLLGFSILAIRGLCSEVPRSAGWWLGVIAAVLSWFSIASGPLAGFAVALWAGARWWLRDGDSRGNLTNLATGSALFIGGISLSLGVPQTAHFRPASVGEFLRMGAGFASWPFLSPTLVVVAWLPFTALVVQRVRAQRLGGRAEQFLFPFGLWVLLQTAVLAFARSRAGGLEVSRYMDLLSPAVLVNLGCLYLLARRVAPSVSVGETRRSGRMGLLRRTFGALWVGAVIMALGGRTVRALFEELPTIRHHNQRERENVAAFVATGDRSLFERATIYDFQSQDLPTTMALLSNPTARRFLPACARPSLVLKAARAERFALGTRMGTPGSTAPGEPAWASAATSEIPGACFRSQPLRATLPYLEFSVFGAAGMPGAKIALVSERNSEVPIWLPVGDRSPGEGWRRVVVKAPPSPFRIEANVEGGPEHNLGLCYPREMGPLSAAVEKFLGAGVEILFLGLAIWAATACWERLRSFPQAHQPEWGPGRRSAVRPVLAGANPQPAADRR